MKDILDKDFWENRWKAKMTGWDIGYPSPPITSFMEKYKDKNAAILIPGCGNAYEAEFLLDNGFTNLTLIDISPTLVEKLKDKFKDKKGIDVICNDFFKHQGSYDLMIEQTFFCTHPLERRVEYVEKAASLLKSKGKIMGVLFNVNMGFSHPPFGGKIADYKKLFSPAFRILKMEECANSIPDRSGAEAFIHLEKR